MARQIFTLSSLTGLATFTKTGFVAWDRATGGQRYSDLYTVATADYPGDPIPNGVLTLRTDGTLADVMGPDDVSVIWLQHIGSPGRASVTAARQSAQHEPGGGGGGGAVDSVVGQTGTVTGTQILNDANVAAALNAKASTTALTTGLAAKADTSALTAKVASTRLISSGTGLSGGGDLSADRTLSVNYGTTSTTATVGNDSRVTGAAQKASNLSDLASASTARTNLGVAYGTTTGTVAQGDDSRITGSLSASTAATTYASLLWTTNSQSGTTYTFVLGDGVNTIVESTNASGVTLTVPPNASVAFPVGCVIPLRQYGAGQITVAPGAGVTIRSRGQALKLGGQYAEAQLTKRATNEWTLSGDVTA